MATEGKYTNEEFDAEVEELVSRTELFIEENKKTIIYGIIAVAVVNARYLNRVFI